MVLETSLCVQVERVQKEDEAKKIKLEKLEKDSLRMFLDCEEKEEQLVAEQKMREELEQLQQAAVKAADVAKAKKTKLYQLVGSVTFVFTLAAVVAIWYSEAMGG